MMRTIAFYNNKGGVSKTTTVINVAYILAEIKKKKVLVVDCDGQQNASRFLAENINNIGVEDTLTKEAIFPESSFSHTRYKNIDMLTSTIKMNECSENFRMLSESEQQNNLEKLNKYCNESNEYDYVLMDMPPALNCITENILSITDGVIVPVELGVFAIQGISKVTEAINKVGATFVGCFISKYDKNNKSDAELKTMLESTLGEKVFDTIIPYSNIIRNSLNYKVTAYEYMKWLGPAKRYVELTEEIIRKVG